MRDIRGKRRRSKPDERLYTNAPLEHTEMSFDDIALEMGVTSQRVGQIYKRAIEKLRAALGSDEGLRAWLRAWLVENMTQPNSRMPARPTQARRYS